ncbi:MAG: hypothetical protein LBI15_12315 [Dysgonamonadaceae bacterium]|jgi:hypothetical protein|nr:hypothetical protein [Dysgonamonadaceae bacterium]
MEKKLTIPYILSEGLALGLKNAASVIGAVVLWILTLWIPYINIGTTIAIASLPLAISKGKVISPLQIFDKKYFKYLGEFFLLLGLMYAGIIAGMAFFIIPGLVIAIAWSLALLLMIDKGLNPIEALTKSNQLTTGHKWTIFAAQLVVVIGIVILSVIFGLLGTFGKVLLVLVIVLIFPLLLGFEAAIYRSLAGEPQTESLD